MGPIASSEWTPLYASTTTRRSDLLFVMGPSWGSVGLSAMPQTPRFLPLSFPARPARRTTKVRARTGRTHGAAERAGVLRAGRALGDAARPRDRGRPGGGDRPRLRLHLGALQHQG